MSYHNNMIIGIMVCLIGMGCLFNSCMQEELQAVAGKANIQIELDNATDFQPTKAVDESTYQDLSKYSLEIWQNETLKNSFSYVNKPSPIELANGTYTLNLRFLRKINGEELEKIDLYILANSESTNMAKKLENKDFRIITREDLQGVTFDYPFGITKEGTAETTEVPKDKGLPISRAITNIEIAGHVADTEIEAKSVLEYLTPL